MCPIHFTFLPNFHMTKQAVLKLSNSFHQHPRIQITFQSGEEDEEEEEEGETEEEDT